MPPIFGSFFGYSFDWSEFICGFTLGSLIIGGAILAIAGVKAFSTPRKPEARFSRTANTGQDGTIYLGKPGKLALGCGTAIILLVPIAFAVVVFSMVFLPEEAAIVILDSVFGPAYSLLENFFVLIQVLGCLFQLLYLGMLVVYLILLIKNETVSDTRKVVFAVGPSF